MEALVKGMTFLLRPWYSAWQGTGALRACYSLRECFALCLGLFCSAIPCPAIPQSGIFSHCYHFSPLWLRHFLPLTLSFLFWLSLDLQFVLSATSLFSFFKEKKNLYSPLCCLSSGGFCPWVGRLNGWVLLGLAQWTIPWSCGLTGWACHSSAVEVEVNSGITVLSGALTMH